MQIDALEEPFIENVVIFQTVLEELKHRSSTIYKRLKDIIALPSRKFCVFVNEHHVQTYIKAEKGEGPNNRNDRAIRAGAKWYQDHLGIKSVLITDDVDNRRKAEELGIYSFSMSKYVEGCSNDAMLEKLSSKRWSDCREGDAVFPPHLSPAEIQSQVKAGKLVTGAFYASRENFLEATVNTDKDSILIQGRECLNRAIDGDTVAVEILPKDQWKAPTNIVLPDEEIISKVEAEIDDADKQVTGKVVGIVQRKWKQYCGILQPSPVPGVSILSYSGPTTDHSFWT
ncbi:hypothetical protein AAG570_009251 [Ranatra chinensis]|uniref:PIN domain-containing protein n=1 Tax=Ranatra chinensis TaxID=642074 RepID=A0ABD0Z620_9HEMI